MSNNSYAVGGRLQVTTEDSKGDYVEILSWGRKTSDEVMVAQGYGRSPLYADQRYYYQSLYFDSSPGPDYIVGGRICATARDSVMPRIEVSRWGQQTGTEVEVFQCFGWTESYGYSIMYSSFFIDKASSNSTPVGGRLQATNLTSTETPFVQLTNWGEATGFEANVANGYGWRSDANEQGYLYQSFYVSTLEGMGVTNVVNYGESMPFPAYTGDQGSAFDYINQQLQNQNILTSTQADTRALIAYCATSEDNYDTSMLATAYSTINEMACPGNINPADWDTVTTQLKLELVAGERVIPLYASNNEFLNSVYINDLSNIMNDADLIDLDPGDTVGFDVLNLFSGGVEIAASISDPEEAAGAWVISSIVSTVVAEIEAHTSTPSVTTTKDQLAQELTTNLNTAISQNDTVLNRIVTDWGKLSAVNTLQSNGLVWPDSQTEEEGALEKAYEIYIWQQLLPIKYAIVNPIVTSTPPGLPCQWILGNDINYQWLGSKSGNSHAANSDVCSKLFGTGDGQLGVPMSDVFNGHNGWSLASIDDGDPYNGGKGA